MLNLIYGHDKQLQNTSLKCIKHLPAHRWSKRILEWKPYRQSGKRRQALEQEIHDSGDDDGISW